MTAFVGWLSSLVLLATIAKQVHTQWKSGTNAGVSRWLFVGQLAASAGFVAYSALVHDWVFVFTNAAMLASALVGIAVSVHHARHPRRSDTERHDLGSTPARGWASGGQPLRQRNQPVRSSS